MDTAVLGISPTKAPQTRKISTDDSSSSTDRGIQRDDSNKSTPLSASFVTEVNKKFLNSTKACSYPDLVKKYPVPPKQEGSSITFGFGSSFSQLRGRPSISGVSGGTEANSTASLDHSSTPRPTSFTPNRLSMFGNTGRALRFGEGASTVPGVVFGTASSSLDTLQTPERGARTHAAPVNTFRQVSSTSRLLERSPPSKKIALIDLY